MKKIKLTQGKFALVDDEDFEYLNQFKWCAHKAFDNYYAIRHVTIDNRQRELQMHRVIMKTPKGKVTDHIDHNGLNNQKSNLRICTARENCCNSKPILGGSSKYKGVSFDTCRAKRNWASWKVSIRNGITQISVGYFKTEKEAALVYNEKAKELFGEFAYLNKIS
ncbi:MAG: HNH endonuclease [Melioribacteraceae bacterium]|jgi:hypothetical protein|nr:HNH endonuclease [Melioribacteraceae bacterium]